MRKQQGISPAEPLFQSVINFLETPATQIEVEEALGIERKRVFEIFSMLERQKRILWNPVSRKYESKRN